MVGVCLWRSRGEAGRGRRGRALGGAGPARTPARGHPASRSASSRAPRTRGLKGPPPPPPPPPSPPPPPPRRSRLSRWAAGPRGWAERPAGHRRGRPRLGLAGRELCARPGTAPPSPGRGRGAGERAGAAHTSAGASLSSGAPAAPSGPGPGSTPTCFPLWLPLGGAGGSAFGGRHALGAGESPGRPAFERCAGFAGFPGPWCFQAAGLSPRPP